MSFVVYDLETTGLAKRFDQITQFAAVRLNDAFEITDRFQTRCRLLQHVVPSPGALKVTGLQMADLMDQALPSHFEMISSVRRTLEKWCPTLFLGFNSISFDEELLRQALYQSLFFPFLTNSQGSARADVLNLCRVTAAIRPDVLVPARNEEGRPLFKLVPLAEANNIPVSAAHEAMSDVMTTVALCRHIRARAPQVWSQFLRFGRKASVEAFITDEDAFLFSETVGNDHRAQIVTRIGQHSEQAVRHYCLDLTSDISVLREMDHDTLTELFRAHDGPMITIRTNAAPTLWSLGDATVEHLAPYSEDEILERVADLRSDQDLMKRLSDAAQAAERVYPPSPHVEDQIYDRREVKSEDVARLRRFHEVGWKDRAIIADQFEDDRYKRLARRIIYFEKTELLNDRSRRAMLAEINRRLSARVEEKTPWRSIPQALAEINIMRATRSVDNDQSSFDEFEAYLLSWQSMIRALV